MAEDKRTAAEVWCDQEPIVSLEHGLRRIRIVSGQTHFLPHERMDRIRELLARLDAMLPAERKRAAADAKAAERAKRKAQREEQAALDALARGGEPREGDEPETPEAPPSAAAKPPSAEEQAALDALARGGEPA